MLAYDEGGVDFSAGASHPRRGLGTAATAALTEQAAPPLLAPLVAVVVAFVVVAAVA